MIRSSRWIAPDEPLAQPRPCVFIDKDGTLVRNVAHNVDASRIEFMPRALQALRRLADGGYLLVLVTNQPGLAEGRFSRADYGELLRALSRRLRDEAGLAFAGVYTCGHAPGPDGRPACLCRKPAPGLLKQAAVSLRLDLARSWMVGDILDDIEAGRRAGCRTVLVDVGNETQWKRGPMREPHVVCHDLLEAAQAIASARQAPPARQPQPA
ncbi:D-glycero-alpha-D-manno-heptose-1,7-bisphosphate 7-phosphatase [Caldimonas sp. KR1-144]|uniref:D-glycero-alpha-D-manno-heptose-1,7-bisphosphate 7-phosphatase n=1 Tax=Caldimonas sp. KR1-144 TaxID=3400911 RepID=UPI003C0E8053